MKQTLASKIEFANNFQQLVTEQAKWSQQTFGPDHVRGPAGPLKHIVKEIEKELLPLVEGNVYWFDKTSATPVEEQSPEWADLLILFLDAIRRAGYKIGGVVDAALEKMKVNRAREWPPLNPDNINEAVEHKRTAEELQAKEQPPAKGTGGQQEWAGE